MFNNNLRALRDLVADAASCFIKGQDDERPSDTARAIASQAASMLECANNLVVVPRAPSVAMIRAARKVMRASPTSPPEAIWVAMVMAAEVDPAA
jgi:hypothetical protein